AALDEADRSRVLAAPRAVADARPPKRQLDLVTHAPTDAASADRRHGMNATDTALVADPRALSRVGRPAPTGGLLTAQRHPRAILGGGKGGGTPVSAEGRGGGVGGRTLEGALRPLFRPPRPLTSHVRWIAPRRDGRAIRSWSYPGPP